LNLFYVYDKRTTDNMRAMIILNNEYPTFDDGLTKKKRLLKDLRKTKKKDSNFTFTFFSIKTFWTPTKESINRIIASPSISTNNSNTIISSFFFSKKKK